MSILNDIEITDKTAMTAIIVALPEAIKECLSTIPNEGNTISQRNKNKNVGAEYSMSKIKYLRQLLIIISVTFVFSLFSIIKSLSFQCILYLIKASARFIFYIIMLPPLHEFGHYLAVKIFSLGKPQSIICRIKWKQTLCSTWEYFSKSELRIIAFSGTAFVSVYCMLLFIITFIQRHCIWLDFPLYIMFEVSCNYLLAHDGDLNIIKDPSKLKTLHGPNVLKNYDFILRWVYVPLLLIITMSVALCKVPFVCY